MRVVLKIIVILALFSSGGGYAQDAQFSQFYAAPLIINPALTGNTIQDRFSLNYRNQWPAVPNSKAFTTYAFSYEHNFEDYNSGVGALIYHDRAGVAGLRTINALFSYAYRVRVTRKFSFKPSLQLGVTNRHLDFGELVFNDQLQTGAASSAASLEYASRSKYSMDVNTGIIGFSTNYWFGVSVHQINRPDISLVGNGARIEPKFSAQGGYNIPVKKDIKKRVVSQLMLAANYKHQSTRDQLDIGGYFNYVPFYMGLWYRSIPLKKADPALANNDAVIVVLGYKKNGLSIGYSYDITVSKLSTATSGGAHELSTTLEIASRKNLSKRRTRSRFMIPCPKF
ncbi:MAG: hypothetical protein CL842_09560 [Crocinitomicaceae bacterium]|nr:hypothetical protein [Crocinitomicaceae bacterium]|tara:strand:- start:186698 stop:187717 length:1020 start_codon:yes stop_codon:yes gene_type:complete